MVINKEGQVLAKLTLSGEEFIIGIDQGMVDCSVMIEIAHGEIVYMSVPETELLIAALNLAKYEANGEKI